MLNILKKYYLPLFAGVLIANVIKTFTASSNHTFQHKLMVILATTIALTAVGALLVSLATLRKSELETAMAE